MSSERQPSRRSDDWSAEIEAWESSGQSKKDYCKARGISLSSFYNWYSKLRQTAASSQNGKPNERLKTRKNPFIPLTPPNISSSDPAFTLTLSNDARLSWQGEASPTYIMSLIKAMQS